MIEMINIHKRFGKNEILKGVNIEVKDGEVVVLLGPSGSGKTTLLRCLNFLEKADQGEIVIGDRRVDVKKASKKEILEIRRCTSMVFQQYNLFRHKTALENVMEGMVQVQKKDKQEAREQAENLLIQVGLGDKINFYPSQLSGGQQQRVGIARALALNPEVILFDEPTSALDPELIGEVLNVMRDVAKAGKTMIVATHEMTFASEIADKVVFMYDGVIAEEGTPEYIFHQSENEQLTKFLKRLREH
ncbi:MAG: amino acid ABC transporter ATP-binding protein [Clostridiales bacterium]|nr:amino acid ABC transporter ATP-binding protein [Clostridiales bacterium]